MSGLSPALMAVLTLLAKATLVVGIAGLIAFSPMARRASAASRHLVWMAAIGVLLALPVLSALLPAWRVIRFEASAAPQALASSPSPAPSPSPSVSRVSLEPTPEPTPMVAQVASAQAPPADADSRWPLMPVWGWVVMGYLAGFIALLGQVAIGRLEVRRLALAAYPADGHWTQLLRELTWITGIDRPVRLLLSPGATMPMTWGTLEPCILLPAEAERWPAERRRVVLLHELAHVERRDCLAQTIAALVCALYWIHPGVWYAARRLRIERELACDDRVLASGTRGRAYAAHLLEVARTFAPAPRVGAVAVTMARPSHLEGRMLAVLDEVRSRRSPSPRMRRATVALSLIGMIPLAAATAGPATSVDPALWKAESFIASVPQEQIVERSVRAEPGGELRVELETGGVLEIAAWDRESIFLHAELAGRDWSGTRVELSRTQGGTLLRARDASGRETTSTGHRFQLRVPARYSVTVQSHGGKIELRNLNGRFVGQTHGGAIELSGLRGHAELATGGGEITVTRSQLDGWVRTGGGNVVFSNVLGRVRGHTDAGQVLGRDAADAARGDGAPLRINRHGGAITVDAAPEGADLRTGGGAIRVGSARGFVRAHTGGGSVKLESVDGDVSVTTGSGAVEVMLAGRPARTRQVDVRSGSGTVIVGIPDGLGVELDVETGYTRSHQHRATIDTDFEVPVRESADYVSPRGGTPRRLVTARGRVGDGRVRVVIRTVNGNVHIRRGGAPSSSADVSRDGRLDPMGGLSRLQDMRSPAGELESLAFREASLRAQLAATARLVELDGYAGLEGLLRTARSHSNASVRAEAAKGLGATACDESIAGLQAMIRADPSAAVQVKAVEELARTVDRTGVDRQTRPEQIRAMLRQVARGHPNPRVRARAAEELRETPRPAAVQSDLTGERVPHRAQLATVAASVTDRALVGAVDAAAIRRLRPALDRAPLHAADLTHDRALWALSHVRDGRLIEPIMAAAEDRDWRVRAYAAWSLGVAHEPRAALLLIGLLQDPTWRVRSEAAAALAGMPDRRAVPSLIALLDDRAWQVRAAAAEALGNTGDPRAAGPLQALLRDPHMAVRGVAEPALRRLRAGRA